MPAKKAAPTKAAAKKAAPTARSKTTAKTTTKAGITTTTPAADTQTELLATITQLATELRDAEAAVAVAKDRLESTIADAHLDHGIEQKDLAACVKAVLGRVTKQWVWKLVQIRKEQREATRAARARKR